MWLKAQLQATFIRILFFKFVFFFLRCCFTLTVLTQKKNTNLNVAALIRVYFGGLHPAPPHPHLYTCTRTLTQYHLLIPHHHPLLPQIPPLHTLSPPAAATNTAAAATTTTTRSTHCYYNTAQVLRQILLDRLEPRTVHWGKRIATFTEHHEDEGSKVTLEFADGTTGDYAVLVGADGINSRIRKHRVDDERKYLGVMAVVGLTTYEHALLHQRGFYTVDGTHRYERDFNHIS